MIELLDNAPCTKSRPMCRREGVIETDPAQRRRILVRGVDVSEVNFGEIEDPMDLDFAYPRQAAA